MTSTTSPSANTAEASTSLPAVTPSPEMPTSRRTRVGGTLAFA